MFYSICQLAIKMKVSEYDLKKLISKGYFPNSRITKHNVYSIPSTDIKEYEKMIIRKLDFLTIPETAEYLDLKVEIVRKMIHKNIFKNIRTFLTFKGYYILKSDIDSYQAFMDRHYTIAEATNLFNLTIGQLNLLIKNKQLPNAQIHKINRKWLLPIKELKRYINSKEIPENFFSIEQVAQRVSRHPAIVQKYIRERKFFTNSLVIKRKRYIPEEDIESFEKTMKVPKGFVTISEAVKLLDKSSSTIHQLIKKKRLANSYFDNNLRKYLINEKDIYAFIHTPTIPDGYVTIEEAANLLSLSSESVLNLIKDKTFQIIHHHKETKFIFKKEIFEFLSKDDLTIQSMSIEEAAKELACSKNDILKLLNKGDIQKSDLNNNRLISKASINNLKKHKAIDYSLDAVSSYQEKINQVKFTKKMPKTINLYNEFSLVRISQTRGNRETFIDKAALLARTLISIIKNLEKEIFLLSDNEIEVLLNNPNLPDGNKENFVHFLNYCTTKVTCSYGKKYKVKYKEKRKTDKEIYDKETFLRFYTYIRDINLHFENSINNSSYAKTWLFVLLHMINGWRKNTIVYELPNLQIELIPELNLYSLKDLEKRKLSYTEAQSIINNYYELCGSIYVSKNSSFSQFLCNQDMVIPTATVLLICELHRRNKNKSTLLGSLNSFVNTSERFTKFFQQQPTLPMFKSLKMNSSLLTHFFYTVTESGTNPEISYDLTKKLRSHRDINSTSTYIQSTNKDGSLESVTINLFNRGHFGWLYNFIVDLSFGHGKINKLEDKTLLIQAYKKDFTPNELEELSYFLLRQQSERKTILDSLSCIPKDILKEKILKILKGEMPSKTKHAQCISFPHCNYPTLNSCLNCPNVILKTHLLVSITEELKKVCDSIKYSEFEAIKYRDTLAFLKLLEIINQAVNELGKEFISSFIDFNYLQSLIVEINNELLLKSPKNNLKN
ncbi:helix-turn-helix domain-containing protein [Peribacillus frigoritolerans]|uniref:helix-turn-helix domain-containing protein n=1 Tax=Peribacillus frigoritolerans TaxID=450367 RepID=UPI003D29235A